MATYTDLTNAIDRLLNLTVTRRVLSLNSTAREKAFEAYALSLIAEAVRRAGGIFTIQGILTGPNPATVVFRAAPGAIYSTAQDFAYLSCQLNGRSFEIHIDVEFEGHTKATHELDISLVDESHADRCRRVRRNPKVPLFTAECKFFSSSVPSIGLARGLVGLVSDFSLRMGSAFISNGATSNLKSYLSQRTRPDPFTDLSPLIVATEERLVTAMEHKLRKWAGV